MSNIGIGSVNLVDSAYSLTADDEDPDFPASNLQLPELAVPFRTTTEGENVIQATLLNTPSTYTHSRIAIALIRHNLSAAGTVKVVISDVGASVSRHDSGDIDVDYQGYWTRRIDGVNRNLFLYVYDGAAIAYDTVEITINDSNDDNYHEVGRLFIGELNVPTIGFAYNWSLGWEDPSEIGESAGGNTTKRRRVKRRVFNCEPQWLTEAEAFDDYFTDLDALIGKTGDALVVPFPRASFSGMATRLYQRVLWGPQGDMGPVANPVFQKFSKSMRFIERT